MLFKKDLAPNFFGLLMACVCGMVFSFTGINRATAQDTTRLYTNDSLPYPIHDTRGDFFSNQRNTFDLANPSNITDSIAYDPATKKYTVYEKIGNKYYRTPTSYTFDEFMQMQAHKAETDYFRKRANTLNILNRGQVKPKLSIYDNLFNRLFGNGKIDIQPQGNVDITAGYQGQNTKNPTLAERARKNGGLDFNMATQLNVNANIGDKLKFPISYNTLANFDFTNQLKLDYTGKDDEILKRFEAGNVSFPSRSTLIPGAQSLFGIKTQLQFGKLFVTAILANQKSQRQSVNLQGGSAAQQFEFKADDYEENRHFLLGQYFKNNYNKAMSNLPAITTPVNILRMEVWVTNKNGSTTNAREIVGLMDLGENNPYHPFTVTGNLPDNNANSEYRDITSNPNSRNPALITNQLQTTLGLSPVQDFEKTFARKLDSTQYIYNAKVGFLSLSQPLQADEVLAVAYQYSYNGRIYQVGEFSQDIPPDSTSANQKVLFLKLLKATSQRPNLPIWQLMMKNVYSVGFGTLDQQDFNLNVLYEQPGLGAKRYLPFGNLNLGTPILTLVNLDRLNNQNDPQPDGVFDFVQGYTVLPQYSRVIFPLLQPFGRDLAPKVFTDTTIARDSLYYPLYDSIKVIAQQQFPNLDRFVIKGSAKSSSSSDISIGYNIPPGSVTVSAGGQRLSENIDYTINYDLGTIKVINQAIINAGVPVQVNFENNATFGLQQKSYLGLRLDYQVKNTAKEQLTIGGTMVRLSERPFFTKVDYGEDPIRNTMYGLDVNYHKDVPRLTKLLDKLPFYTTTAPSAINAYAEAAYLKPGHAPQIGKGSNGVVYIDDFEGSKSDIDLRFPPISWALASTPYGATDSSGNTLLFPEAANNDNLDYGKNRAKIAWYQIEPTLQDPKNINNPLRGNKTALSDARVRAISQTEIFPQITTDFGQNQLVTFDLAYYPTDRGPYNYDASAADVSPSGKLLNPSKRWGGLMRSIDQTDFETANVEYIECWVQDPFINNPASNGGKFFINLGNISEDVLKDSRRFYENGLPTPNLPAQVDTSIWGVVPRNPTQVTNAFSNDPNDRPYQDVGFDGLTDSAEITKRRTDYLNVLAANFGTGSQAYKNALADPSSDNYHYYRGSDLDKLNADILTRYKNFNSPQGNSPIADNNSQYSSAATLYPDQEDLNRDNTLNETEEYFQYTVDLKPPTSPEMNIGQNFIVDKKVVNVKLVDGTSRPETWYQLRIPIENYNKKIGNIPDFKSIRFIRMFLTGFDDSVVVRFGKLALVRNTWRKFQYKIDTTGNYSPEVTNDFNVGAVNIEENDKRSPLPYRTPADIQRVQTLSNNGVNLLQNEQSLTLQFCGLNKNDGKAVFQTFANRDLRQFRKLQMYIHAEKTLQTQLNDDDLVAVVRIGSDFVSNYYEVKIPLKLTPLNTGLNPDSREYNDTLWIQRNNLDLDLDVLTKIKNLRNLSTAPINALYSQLQSNGQTYSIIGNPNLGQVTGILMGVKTVNGGSACGELWFNELRLSSLDEKGGWASLARVDANLADLGTISLSANTHSHGFGTLEQRVGERYKDYFLQLDAAANLELGKLLPKKAALSIPFYASYSKAVSTPQYDPLDQDITLKQKLSQAPKRERDSIRSDAVDFTSTKTISFTNVHKNRTSNKKPKPWDIENVDLSYSYTKTEAHNPLIEYDNVTKQRAGVGYNFTPQPKYFEPFKKLFKKTKTHWFDLIKDFNINPLPSQFSFRADIFRQFGVIKPRSIGGEKYVIPETFDKYFTFDRNYIVRWDITHSFNIDYSALNNARIDEPYGRLNTKAKQDTVRRNFFAGGRNTVFTQTINFSYNVPLNKFPLTDWTTLRLGYTANYQWIGASRLAVNLGNFLENGQQEEANLQLDFTRLYSKSKWLRAIDQPRQKTERDTSASKKPNPKTQLAPKPNNNTLPEVNGPARVLGKLLTSIKSINATVSQNSHTRLPGYTDSTQILGENFRSMAPGFDFILGRQPDTNWLNKAARKGLITRDSTFNDLFVQSFDQKISASAQLEPVRDLTIDVNIDKTFSKNFSETFKDTTGTGNHFSHLSPYVQGGFSVSYIAFNTLFGKYDPNQISSTFLKFQDYRQILSKRLGQQNTYNKLAGNPISNDGYALGYGRYAVDVLVPSFIAAYTGQDPLKVSLVRQNNSNIKSNPFRDILPKPNWRITFNGLSRVPGLDKIFTNFSLTHAYNASLGMNSFTSALYYQDVSRYGYPSFIDTTAGNNNYIPFFLIPNITIQEQFAPLLGIDMTFTNQLSLKFEYLKQRQLSLSLIDYQLSEVRSTQYTFGGGFRKKGLKLPFKVPFAKKDSKKLDNEMNFRLDFSVRDNVTSNSRLDQNSAFATNGSKEITISPTIDYYISNRINVKLYFDQRRVNPYISSSPPTVDTRAGVQVRISLSQ
ncbi:cell surface protein SprA [Ginsengibacter hankyongi]|uniref:Cell surface protein SprA n=1 Tax=Ginsengibacter hankyongi TaxID=2607284 RepID=A0A5J5IKG9_9BACT|nr:cell surface protein SprA [Ginsengibacter hankyongi]KAA9041516.1 cell surface protein SprA [Ginsengibacter hankyongi]